MGDGRDYDDYTTNDGRFSYKERRLDGYALVKWEVNDALNVETGVRAENTRTEQRYSSAFLEGGVLQDTVSGQAENDAFMLNPSAHVQWKDSEADQLRFGVARTVRRPSIAQLIPASSLDRSDERLVGKGCVTTWRYRGSPYQYKK